MAFDQRMVFSGLGTFILFNAPTAGPYFIDGKLTLPTIVGGSGASSVVAVINKNGSPVYTGLAGAEGFFLETLLAVNDAMTLVLSSAAAQDNVLNAVKTMVDVGGGQ